MGKALLGACVTIAQLQLLPSLIESYLMYFCKKHAAMHTEIYKAFRPFNSFLPSLGYKGAVRTIHQVLRAVSLTCALSLLLISCLLLFCPFSFSLSSSSDCLYYKKKERKKSKWIKTNPGSHFLLQKKKKKKESVITGTFSGSSFPEWTCVLPEKSDLITVTEKQHLKKESLAPIIPLHTIAYLQADLQT